MTYKKINELEENDKVDGFFLVKSIDRKTSSNGKEYFDLILSDSTGDIVGKIWESHKGEGIQSNKVVKVRGEVTLWKNTKQFKVHKVREVTEEDNVSIDEFIQSAPIKSEDMIEEIYYYINNIKNKDIKKLVEILLERKAEKLYYYPAAKENHHSIKGGLLYHILRMLRAGKKLIEVYTELDSDLVYAGVILHDLSKIEEMESNELGVVSDYSMEGKLLGHIVQGVKEIDLVSKENNLDEEISILIQHMILSHHYYPEYGSPRFPMIPEAEILHYIDVIDARIYDMEKSLKDIEEGSFSNKIWTLDNRQLYKRREKELK